MGAALPAVAIAATIASTAVAAYGQYQSAQAGAAQSRAQGQAAAQQATYQAAVADINRRTALRNQALHERNAQYIEAGGARQGDDRARRLRQTVGAQRAALAANGLLIEAGTSGADMIEDTTTLGRMALSEVGENTRRQAFGQRIAAYNALEEATTAGLRGDAYRGSGANAIAAGEFGADRATTAGWLGVGSSLLSGATNSFDRWADMRRTGVVNNNPPALAE